uniref:Uncharacterized protein n=1 Tax=Heterorhabditis bacteriophora TaxID=37862 RepID=A0A1I7X7J6_HETBA
MEERIEIKELTTVIILIGLLQQHSSLAGTRREYSVEYAVFGGSSC